MYKKWFGDLTDQLTQHIETPLSDLDQLKILKERYADTLEAFDEESKSLEQEFEAIL